MKKHVTKQMKILLAIFCVVVVAAGIYLYYLKHTGVQADTAGRSAPPAYGLSSTDPATPSKTTKPRYDWPTSSRVLTARYSNTVYTPGSSTSQIKASDVAVKKVKPDGSEEDKSAGITLQSADNGRTVMVNLPGDFEPNTIYHWTIKPSGSIYTASVNTEFLTTGTGLAAPTISSLTEAANATVSMQVSKPALCVLELYKGTAKNATLFSDVTYGKCSADLYARQGFSVSMTTNGTTGMAPSSFAQQTFNRLTELNSRGNDYGTPLGSSNAYSIKATAINVANKAAPATKTLAISHIDPVGFSQTTQVGANTYKLVSEQIYGLNGKAMANTPISIVVTHNGSGATTSAYTTDANGRITIPAFTVDTTKTEFVEFNATYSAGTVNLPVISSKFLLVNY